MMCASFCIKYRVGFQSYSSLSKYANMNQMPPRKSSGLGQVRQLRFYLILLSSLRRNHPLRTKISRESVLTLSRLWIRAYALPGTNLTLIGKSNYSRQLPLGNPS